MDVRQIGNELLRKQTLYEQSLKQSEAAMNDIAQKLGSITPEQVQACLQIGVDISPLLNADLERMKHDQEYRNRICAMQNTVCNKLIEILEREICSE